MRCVTCGEPNPSTQTYCVFCGSFALEPLHPPSVQGEASGPALPAATAAVAMQKCWRCNAAIAVDIPTCPACGLVMRKPGAASPVPAVSLLQRLTVRYAGLGRRFTAMVIDLVILRLAQSGFGFVTGLLLAVAGVDAAHPLPNLTAIFTVLNVIMAWLYFAGLESSARQATPGKRMLGIRVTDEDGDRLPLLFTSVRFGAKLLAGPLLVGFLIAAFNARKQALHDMAAGSLVVRG